MAYLSRGCKGEEVRKMQTALNRAGCTITVDGIYGDKTVQAVIKFQKKHFKNSKDWDGVCGPKTMEHLAPYMQDYTLIIKAIEECVEAVSELPEYKKLEDLLYG